MRLVVRALPIVLLAFALVLLVRPRSAGTVPLYAARQGLMCQTCHFDPNGGGPRNDFGFAYARNRHALAPEDSASAWHDLDLTNRVGDRMPLYVGLNQRFMLLSNRMTSSPNIDRFGFFNMENGIHLAFQPHQRLTLVYTLDSNSPGGNTFRSREAFGMISGFPWDGYLKAGRIRTPYGLRMDDHTVATRNGFGDFGSAGRFLPYDPRSSDMGVEIGADRGSVFGRAAFTNGRSDVFGFGGDPYAEAKTVKVGYNNAWYQGGVSLYDDFLKLGSKPYVRDTRWGYYGMTHCGPVAVLGEVGAGTDHDLTSGAKTNLLAWFGEADYALTRWVSFRARYDYLVDDRSSDRTARSDHTYRRYALEGEVVPVPFAELRWALRYVDPRDGARPDERQAYLQAHFSY
ncbi:MAG: hypothetical protein HZC42_11490 [Candidatus Eisenbacteria bacterium]|nr:hypothetical protein [Candidatus Eisenbacteria bacterium]